jgi:hypothetical protein
MPLSLVFFVSGENQRDHRAHAGHGMPGPSGVPTSPDDPYWTDLQGAVREVWESVKPLLAEL